MPIVGLISRRRWLSAVTGPLLALALAGGASAAGPKLQLYHHDGTPAGPGSYATIESEFVFPGFTCEGISAGMELLTRGPRPRLTFHYGGEYAGEAFNECETTSGKTFSAEKDENGPPRLVYLAITSERVTERFNPVPSFEDDAECLWTLRTLTAPLPSSGVLENLHFSGTIHLDRSISPHSCPKTESASGISTIHTPGESSHPGVYYVESVG